MKSIVISGKGGSGKDSLCNYFKEYIIKHNKDILKYNKDILKYIGVYSLSFADPIKEIFLYMNI